MRYFSYMTDACRIDAERFQQASYVMAVMTKIDKDQTLAGLDHHPNPFHKKVLGRSFRLVLAERLLDDERTVLAFVAVYKRGDAEYERFVHEDTEVTGRLLGRIPAESVLRDFVTEQEATHVMPLPQPSPAEVNFLLATRESVPGDDWIVLESRPWVRMMASPAAAQWLVSLYEVARELVECLDRGPEPFELRHPTQQDIGIRACVNQPYRKLLLIRPYFPSIESSAESDRELQQLEAKAGSLGPEDFLRLSEHAYPALVLVDRDVWKATQEPASSANLALSPEEAEILSSVIDHQSGPAKGGGYPLFINGRPGSGKSTVLQYLFAEHLYAYMTLPIGNRPECPPLYLTYSRELLKRARNDVRDLLRCDATRAAAGSMPLSLSDPSTTTLLSRSFQLFRSYVLGLLPPDEQGRFAQASHVSFGEFRKRWRSSPQRSGNAKVRSLSAEIAWHVIRTYIKGMQQGSNPVDPDWYRELPKKRRSVTDETFSLVYEHVWAWYQNLCERDGLWDDQDLTLAALALEGAPPDTPVVFCDEAQDFTKNELELISRFSLFLRRNLPANLLSRVPIAFAGDPFQTLNPTGFDWTATRANYIENFVRHLDRGSRGKLDLNYRELSYNYRSAQGIVRFGNLIQLARGVSLDVANLLPQRAWALGSPVAPTIFNAADPDSQRSLENASSMVILIPCQEGEEEAYISQDEVLRRVAMTNGRVSRNVLSAMRAKGLEFEDVVLYKFGEKCLEEYPDLAAALSGSSAGPLQGDSSLRASYFLNGLFVAATRPRRRLLIVDTKNAISGFWLFAMGEGPERLRNAYQRAGWTSDGITRVMLGQPEDWHGGQPNQEEMGRQLQEQGLQSADPYLLQLAANNYRSAGNEDYAMLADAQRLRMSGALLDAAPLFERLGKPQEALDCLWKASAFGKVVGLMSREASLTQRPEVAFSRWVEDGALISGMSDVLARLRQAAEPGFPTVTFEPEPAMVALEKALARYAESPASTLTLAEAAHLAQELSLLSERRPGIRRSLGMVRLLVEADRGGEALAEWRSLSARGKPPAWLLSALAETEPYPARLRHLADLERWLEVVAVWRAHPDEALGQFAEHLVRGLLSCQLWGEALSVAAANGIAGVAQRVATLSRGASEDARRVAGGAILAELLRRGKWREAAEFAGTGVFPGDEPPAGGGRAPEALRAALVLVLVEHLATEREIASLPEDIRLHFVAALRPVTNTEAFDDFKEVRLWQIVAALERLGGVATKAAMDLCRRVESGASTSSEVRQFARERWLRCIRRQAKKADGSKRRRLQLDLKAREREWGIVAERLSMFPDPTKAPKVTLGELFGAPTRDHNAPDVAVSAVIAEPESGAVDLSMAPSSVTAELPVPGVVEPPLAASDTPVVAGAPHWESIVLHLAGGEITLDVSVSPSNRRLEIREPISQQVTVVRAAGRTVRSADDLEITRTESSGYDGLFDVSPWGIAVGFVELGGTTVACVLAGRRFVVGFAL